MYTCDGRWSIQLFVECHNCGKTFDLLDTDWWRSGGHEEFRLKYGGTCEGVNVAEFPCPKCKKELMLYDVN